ncbi:hypothetical protein SEA_MOAB_166 [Streptomyces phage Moab]|nr:hypothetical protein SEA_MOAB_166 [Streptomyces phage Moab]
MSQSTTFEQLPLFSVTEIPWGYCYDCYTEVEFDIRYSKPWCAVCEKRVHTHGWSMQKKFKELTTKNRFLTKKVIDSVW